MGLVQGRRRKPKVVKEDIEDPVGGGAGDSESKVTQINMRVLKKTPIPPQKTSDEAKGCGNQKRTKLRIELERLFTGFCIEHKIPLQFLNGEGDSTFSKHSGGQEEGGQGGKSKSDGVGGGGGETKHVEKSFRSTQGSGSAAGGSGAAGGGAGGSGGGDKRPPGHSGSESSIKINTTEADLTSDASSTTSSRGGHALPGRRKKKRATIYHDGTHQKTKKPHLTVTDTDPEGVLLVNSFSMLGKKLKKSTIDVGKHQYPGGNPDSMTKRIKKSILRLKPEGLTNQGNTSSLQVSKPQSPTSFSSVSPSSPSTFVSISPDNSGSEGPEPQPLLLPPPWVPPQNVRENKNMRLSGRRPSHFAADVVGEAILISNEENFTFSIAAERNSEWLQRSSSEEESLKEDGIGKENEDYLELLREEEKLEETKNDDPPQEKEDQFEIQPDLKLFMESTRVLDKVHSVLGLFPYQKIVGKNHSVQVKWVPRSLEYFGVCVNACIFVIITLSGAFSLGILAEYSDKVSTTQQIVQNEFVNFFPDNLFIILFSILLSVWSVSCVMELGIHYAEFYTRFNLGVCLLKYDVTSGLHQMIVGVFTAVAIFNLFITTLFFAGRKTEVVRNGMGFLGFIILRPYNFALRESIYYPFAQILGLLVFLYFFLCLNVLLLHLAVYGKALGNMGSQFNLRLAYTLGKLGKLSYGQNGKKNFVKKIIPFEQLYAEHLIIVSLFRMLSQVNCVVFRTFLFCVICEIILCIWLLFDLFLDTGHSNVEIFLENVGPDVQLPVRVRANELLIEAIIKAFLMFAITMCGYFLFIGIHISNDYIRRYGLTFCASSRERRFILSMITSFTTNSAYWVGKIFQISRPFVLRLTGFIFVVSMVVVSYHPERLSLSLIEQCTQQGQCLSIKLFRFQTYLFYAANDNSAPPTNSKPPPFVIIPPPPYNESDPKICYFFPPNLYLENPPCASYSTHTLTVPHIAKMCPANWTLVKSMYIPYLYKPVAFSYGLALSSPDGISKFYGKIHQPFISFPGSYHNRPSVAECPGPDEPYYNFPYLQEFGLKPFREIVDCFGQSVIPEGSDDCGNPPFITPSSLTSLEKRKPPIFRLIAMNQLTEFRKDDERFFCCYQFALSSPNEVRVCNMPDRETLRKRCRLEASRDLYLFPFVGDLKKKRKEKDVLASTVPYDDEERMRWTDCICDREKTACEKLKPPTNGSTTTSTTTTTTTTTTSTTTKPPLSSPPPPPSPPTKGTTTTSTTTTTTTTTPPPPSPRPPSPSTTTSTTTTTTSPPDHSGIPCLSKPTLPIEDWLFTKCDVRDKVGNWANLDTILYPNILKKKKSGAYRQHVPMDMKYCNVNGIPQFPYSAIPTRASPPIHDCFEMEYPKFDSDDCWTPIFPWPSSYNFNPHLRAVVFDRRSIPEIKCCFDLGFSSLDHRKQALVCNMPSRNAYEKNCAHNYNPDAGELAFLYRDSWRSKNETEQEVFERHQTTLQCVCYHLDYVREKFPPLVIPPGLTVEQYCRDYFNRHMG
ncbi:unnamed protein product [Orchesella dallaii]|uniref:Uncharacterized protein n=1 Tax=Orchesella dallaii TaxID=48710 RepID=A0ABP1RP94_9HEXA